MAEGDSTWISDSETPTDLHLPLMGEAGGIRVGKVSANIGAPLACAMKELSKHQALPGILPVMGKFGTANSPFATRYR
jgi:hypothetical protein